MPTSTVAPPPGIEANGIELFKLGTRRDSEGRVREWTETELDEIVSSYNTVAGTIHDAPAIAAPIVKGHEGTKSYGWLRRAYREGSTLMGDYRDVDPEFASSVNVGNFRKRSISLYPPTDPDNPTPGKWNIRHVAYVPVPSIKGMKDHTFSEAGEEEELYVDFSEGTPETPAADATPEPQTPTNFEASAGISAIAQIFQAQRDRLIEAKGLEEADKVFPAYLIESLTSAGRESYLTSDDGEQFRRMFGEMQSQLFEMRERCDKYEAAGSPTVQPSYTEANPVTTENTNPTTETITAADPDLVAQLLALKAEFAEFKTNAVAEKSALTAEIDGLKIVNQTQAFNAERDRIRNFVESQVKEKRVRPADAENKIRLLLSASTETTVNFGEGDSAVSKSLRQALMDDISSSPALWSDEQLPTGANHAPKGSSTANFSAPTGFSIDPESARQHELAVNYCEANSLDWRNNEHYTRALIATAD